MVCPDEGELPERLRDMRIPVVIQKLSRWNRDEAWRFLTEVPRHATLLRRADVSLVHGNTSASRRSLLQAVQWLCVPYIQHVRNIVKEPRCQPGFRLAKRIVANSDSAARILRDDPLFSHKTITIHNGVDLSRYETTTDRREFLGAAGRPIIGFVGQIVPRKGVTTLIRAMPMVLASQPQALAVIVGCAPPDETEYESECRALVRELGVDASVRFVGYQRDVPSWMRTFDVFALPTRAEPFGKVVIEAMAAERPVVVSDVGGIPEIVSEPRLGTLIAPDDPAMLADGILRYLYDRDLARRVSRAGAHHVRGRFGVAAMVARLQALYDDVLGTVPRQLTAEAHASVSS